MGVRDIAPRLRRRDVFQSVLTLEWWSDVAPRVFRALIFGLINTIMCVPWAYGYASVIFAQRVYRTFMPALCKLVLFSCAVHQLAFSLGSSLPFAIGQVQDGGLIFLAHMARNIAHRTAEEAPEVTVATAVACTALSTALLGLALLLFGRLKWARFVSYLPVPVIGGYLAFIGFFCIEAGLGLCVGHSLNRLEAWLALLEPEKLVLAIPCVVTGLLFMLVGRMADHPAPLPTAMCVVPGLFYLWVWLSGNSLEDARAFGWLAKTVEPPAPMDVAKLFQWDLVQWSALPEEFPVWLGMVFVVSFSSCLDVAAIEMDMGKPLNKNKELCTVGWSNLFSGITGGFSGSYIFSQTILTYRTQTRSRIVGAVVLIAEVVMFFLPFDPLQFVPLFFFAGALVFIGFELVYEWLWEASNKLIQQEYAVLVVTFLAILFVGVNGGMLIGICSACLLFMASHQDATQPVVVERRSRKFRQKDVRKRIQDALDQGKILTVELSGTLFFGSSVKLLEDLTKLLEAAASGQPAKPVGRRTGRTTNFRLSTADLQHSADKAHWFDLDVRQDSPVRAKPAPADDEYRLQEESTFGLFDEDLECAVEEQQNLRFSSTDTHGSHEQSGVLLTDLSVGNLMGGMFHSRPRSGTSQSEEENSFLLVDEERQHGSYGAVAPRYSESGNSALDRQDSTDMLPKQSAELERGQSLRPSRMLVLDMLNVGSVDASAARNCFNMLRGECMKRNCGLVYARCNRRVTMQLQIHGCLDTIKHSEERQSSGTWIGVSHFSNIDEAMDFCESTLLADEDSLLPLSSYNVGEAHGEAPSSEPVSSDTVAEIIYEIAENNALPRERNPDAIEISAIPNMTKEKLSVLDDVARIDTYEEGETIFKVKTPAKRFFVLLAGTVELCPDGQSDNDERRTMMHPLDSPGAPKLDRNTSHPLAARLYRGAIFGFVDFQLAQLRRFSCVTLTRTRVASFSSEDLRFLLTKDPFAAWSLNCAVLYYSSVELANSGSL